VTPAAFLAALERTLRYRGVPFSRGDLMAFVLAAWPGVEEPVDVERWAGEFLESQLRGLVDGIGVMPDLSSVAATLPAQESGSARR
jgi:hypothetical protein